MREICVNCGTKVRDGYYCPKCGLYVQVEEVSENWKITLTVELYVSDMEKEEAQDKMDELVARICDLDRDIVINDEYIEEK